MIITLSALLKTALSSGDAITEFDYRLSTYSPDFLLNREELGKCWQYLSEHILDEGARDLFITIGEIIYREKLLRSLWNTEREFWRTLIEHNEDVILQKTMITHYLANKPQNYLGECRKRIHEMTNALGTMMADFFNPPEEPWISLNDRFGTVRDKFRDALARAQEVLDEEQAHGAA